TRRDAARASLYRPSQPGAGKNATWAGISRVKTRQETPGRVSGRDGATRWARPLGRFDRVPRKKEGPRRHVLHFYRIGNRATAPQGLGRSKRIAVGGKLHGANPR